MGHLLKKKMRRFQGECAHFSFNKWLIYTHDGASAKFSINSHETDNSSLTFVVDGCCTVQYSTIQYSKVQYIKVQYS
jgi:hypothetical protein